MSTTIDQAEIAETLRELGALLALRKENPFKVRAYDKAAEAIEEFSGDLPALAREGRLTEIRGVGAGIAEKITELVTIGRLQAYEELLGGMPKGIAQLAKVPGLGMRRAQRLHEALGISTVRALEDACRAGRVAAVPGFGVKTQQRILDAITQRSGYAGKFRHWDLLRLAQGLLDALREHPDVVRVELAGSMRRGNEVVHDIDLVASSKNPEAVFDAFAAHKHVTQVTARGESRLTAQLSRGVPCDLLVVPDQVFAHALHHATGNRSHNITLRRRALDRELHMSQWGFFKESTGESLEGASYVASGRPADIVCPSEEEIYQALGLQWMPPELRENSGEIEAAEKNQVPRLVEWTDLRGTFHCHTTDSDGKNTLEEMAEAARELGFDYLGIADHSKSSHQANGQTEERLLDQIARIRALNKKYEGFRLFAGCEVDILKDGRLDFEDSILKELDYAVASVHRKLHQDEAGLTRAVIRAMENPYIRILGHATGRLLLHREPNPVNLEKIIDCAAATGTWIELNASPWRLDMDWRWWHRARDKGVQCTINPDAHSVREFAYLRLGVTQARKGWLRKEDVINTGSIAQVEQLLQAKRPAPKTPAG